MRRNDVFPIAVSKIHYSSQENTGFTLFLYQILLLMIKNNIDSVFARGNLLDVWAGEVVEHDDEMGGIMMVREGERIKSTLTEKIYEVKTIKDRFVVLQSLAGLNHIWTERGNLKLFYEKVEREEVLNVPLSPGRKKPLRGPSKVVLDFL